MPILILLLSFQEPGLSQEETALLDALFSEGLFDPVAAGSRRVRGTVTLRTCYGGTRSVEASGWLITDGGRPERLILNNLQWVRAPEHLKTASFLEETAGREISKPALSDEGPFTSYYVHRLVLAAWLHKIGLDTEAAGVLPRPMGADPIKRFRNAYGWSLFDQAVNAYIVGEDADALEALERLVLFESVYYHAGKELLAEVQRRKKSGTFGKPPSPPTGRPGCTAHGGADPLPDRRARTGRFGEGEPRIRRP